MTNSFKQVKAFMIGSLVYEAEMASVFIINLKSLSVLIVNLMSLIFGILL